MKTYKDIFGFFDFEDIYDKALTLAKDGDIFLEIGCLLGKSTAYMANGIKNNRKDIKFVVLDTFLGNGEQHNKNIEKHAGGLSQYDAFIKNLDDCGVRNYVTSVFLGSSQDQNMVNCFSDNSISFIFIDAAHEYHAVLADLELWYPKLKKGGIIGGHDYTEPTCGVQKAVDEWVKNNSIVMSVSKNSWCAIKYA